MVVLIQCRQSEGVLGIYGGMIIRVMPKKVGGVALEKIRGRATQICPAHSLVKPRQMGAFLEVGSSHRQINVNHSLAYKNVAGFPTFLKKILLLRKAEGEERNIDLRAGHGLVTGNQMGNLSVHKLRPTEPLQPGYSSPLHH